MMTLHGTRIAALPATLALALLAGTPAPLHAQTDRERAQQNPGDWEWDQDEGYHKEEWYDPSDWFDGENTIDYEYDWYDTDDDAYGYDYDYGYDSWNTGWVTGSDWYDGYWDGYSDGYSDDRYGYDTIIDLGTRYGNAYTSGYYDGYYDNDTGYDYDPYYYISTWNYDDASASQRQRAGDQARQRGDRAMSGQGSSEVANSDRQRRSDAQGQNTMARQKHEKNLKRVRGEVQSVEFLRGTGRESGTDLIARITFKEDGKSRVVNMGPKMSRSDVPFSQGDTVTLKGERERHRDREVLTTYKLNVNGQAFTLAGSQQMQGDQQRSSQRQQRMTQLEGTIRDVASVDIDREKYTVLRVELHDGSEELIAFTSDRIEDREEFDARRGDRIRIRGKEQQLDGRSVIRPDRVLINGQQLSMR